MNEWVKGEETLLGREDNMSKGKGCEVRKGSFIAGAEKGAR